jgi:hypothetical protein
MEKAKNNSAKQFPNGFTSWMETHHEIVSLIAIELASAESESKVKKADNAGGTIALYKLAEQWTDKFEEENKATCSDYWQRIENFYNKQNNTNH